MASWTLYALGRCQKRDGWIISIYRRIGEPYNTIRIRKVKTLDQDKERINLLSEPSYLASGHVAEKQERLE